MNVSSKHELFTSGFNSKSHIILFQLGVTCVFSMLVTSSILGWMREKKSHLFSKFSSVESSAALLQFLRLKSGYVKSFIITFQNFHGIFSCRSELFLCFCNCCFKYWLSLGQYTHIVFVVIWKAYMSILRNKTLMRSQF